MRVGMLAICLVTLGCSSSGTGIPLSADEFRLDWDAGALPSADPPIPPELPVEPSPPAEAARPSFLPCPAGWSEIVGGVTTCEPWPEGQRPTCAEGSAPVPGANACVRMGSACPAGAWPEGLPDTSAAVYVDPGAAPGGDGSLLAPFALLAEALAVAEVQPGTVVALGRGVFPASLEVPASTTLIGTCATDTVITDDPGVVGAGAILSVSAPGVLLKNVQLRGDAVGLSVVGSTADLDLDGVFVADALDHGVWVDGGATLTGRHVRIQGTRVVGDGTLGMGLEAIGGSHVELASAVLDENHEAAVLLRGAQTTANLTDVAILDTRERTSDATRGFGLVAVGDAGVVATRLLLEGGEATAILAHTGATMTLTDVVARDSRGNVAAASAARGMLVGGAAQVDATRVQLDNNEEVGILLTDPDTVLRMNDSVVRRTASALGQLGRGIHLQAGATLEGTRLWIEANHEVGLFLADAGTAASVTDFVAIDQRGRELDGSGGMGVVVQAGAELTLEGARLERNTSAGLFAGGSGVMLELSDLTVKGTQEGTLTDDGRGLFVQGGTTIHLARALFEENHAGALVASQDGTTLRAEDVVARDTLPTEAGVGGHGFVALDGASFAVTRGLLERNHQLDVAAGHEGTTVLLEDVTVRDTVFSGNDAVPLARAINLQWGARAEGRRILIERSGDVAIAVLEHESLGLPEVPASCTLEDVTVRDTRGTGDGLFGRALHVQGGTTVTLTRGLIEENREVGIAATIEATVTLTDVSVRGTHNPSCEGCMQRVGIGIGAYGGAVVDATRFESTGNGTVGVQVGFGAESTPGEPVVMNEQPGELHLHMGRVSDNPIGANLGIEGYPIDDIMDQVSYLRNGRNLDAVDLPTPGALAGGLSP